MKNLLLHHIETLYSSKSARAVAADSDAEGDSHSQEMLSSDESELDQEPESRGTKRRRVDDEIERSDPLHHPLSDVPFVDEDESGFDLLENSASESF